MRKKLSISQILDAFKNTSIFSIGKTNLSTNDEALAQIDLYLLAKLGQRVKVVVFISVPLCPSTED